jgi:YD repeat-containing protein
MTYDERGQLFESYLPQFSSTLDFEAINGSDTKIIHHYDALGRKVEEISPVGASTVAYGAWSQTLTDANGHPKDLAFDAYGRLIQVTEHNGAENYVTSYDYNANGQLIQVTDAEGKIMTVYYDLLGRRTQQTLLHDIADPAPATYSFTYDSNGNLLTRTDAEG